jgi:hypothetical protein
VGWLDGGDDGILHLVRYDMAGRHGAIWREEKWSVWRNRCQCQCGAVVVEMCSGTVVQEIECGGVEGFRIQVSLMLTITY